METTELHDATVPLITIFCFIFQQRNERNLEAKKQHVQKLETRKQMLETDLAEKKAARAQLRETRRNIRVQEERSAIVIQGNLYPNLIVLYYNVIALRMHWCVGVWAMEE
jgi:7-cyano-7-deazaguanine synthase in queuosine biosynthesis